MPLEALEHYTIQCADLTGTRDFYRDVLGLVDGPRPNFGFSGHWLYCGDVPVVHLMGPDHVRPKDQGAAPSIETGALDHIAFRGSDVSATLANLKKSGVAFRESQFPGTGLHQLFVRDPNGIMVELNFRA
jgi:catechol 2,3-dioxygenase-like lactoylglutathione lyase family enzyme